MIRIITIEEFNSFQNNNEYSNCYQSINYALLMSEEGYDNELIGYFENGTLLAAALILCKKIGNSYYGYAPRGFLIDYHNEDLLRKFTNKLKDYYYDKGFAFIKVNPNISIGKINKIFNVEYNQNKVIQDYLLNNNYKKLKDNLYFESKLPRFNAFINLFDFDFKKIDKNSKNKIKKGIRKGLKFEKCDKDKYNEFYKFIKNKTNHDEFYYQDYYSSYEKTNDADLFLVSIDYNAFFENSEYIYNLELENNVKHNEKIMFNPSEKAINKKIFSDKKVLSYKNDILEATKGIKDNKNIYVAGALVVKHNNVATIVISGFDKEYTRFAPNYFLYYSIIKYYQDKCDFIDLNGVVGDFNNKDNPYYGLNRFKLSFNPEVYEFIGEYDLVVNETLYYNLSRNGSLIKEFNKKNIKK